MRDGVGRSTTSKGEWKAREGATLSVMLQAGGIGTAKGLLQIENGCGPRATLESGFLIKPLTRLTAKL